MSLTIILDVLMGWTWMAVFRVGSLIVALFTGLVVTTARTAADAVAEGRRPRPTAC